MGEAFSFSFSSFLFVFLFCGSLLLSIGDGASVEYDHRALVIDGKRRVLISGSIHYPRSTPEVISSLSYSWPAMQCNEARCFFSFSFIKDKKRRERRVEETDILECGDVADVARSCPEIQRWRSRCHRHLCILEPTRTCSESGTLLTHLSFPRTSLSLSLSLSHTHTHTHT